MVSGILQNKNNLINTTANNKFNKTRTKLTLIDIQQFIELCVSECYFLRDNVIWNLIVSGPISLSIMLALSESYL